MTGDFLIVKKYLSNPLVTGTIFLTLAGTTSRFMGFFFRIFLFSFYFYSSSNYYYREQSRARIYKHIPYFTASALNEILMDFIAHRIERAEQESKKRIIIKQLMMMKLMQ